MLFFVRLLGLDIGTRRTGVAWLDDQVGIPLPLSTVTHTSQEELVAEILSIIGERVIDHVIIGLPLLPSGDEGAQSQISRATGALLSGKGIAVSFADERYTSPRTSQHKHAISEANYDGDAAAACSILSQKTGI